MNKLHKFLAYMMINVLIISMLHQNGLYGNMWGYWVIAVPSFMGAWWIVDKLDKIK